MDGDDFVHYQKFCLEHNEELRVPTDFTDTDETYDKFERMLRDRYPGRVLGKDISFDDMDHDLQLAYAEYNHEYYLLEFEKAAEKFGIAYAYYIVPEPWIGDNYVMYMLDAVREPYEYDTDYINIGQHIPQVIDRHQILWEAWNTGKSPEGYDTFDNQYGKTYAYYTPLYINGEKLGLIATEVDIETVNSAILHNTMIQFSTFGAVLLVFVVLMLILIHRKYIRRIIELESGVREYAGTKAPEIADKLTENAVGRHEIASLSIQTAEMVRELDRHIKDMQVITAEKEKAQAELNVAAHIQADMLPRDFPDTDGFSLYASMTPAKEVGGDFYDFFMTDEDHIALVMADVSGKGVPAALFMVIAKTLIKNRALSGGDPARILEDVNSQLCENNQAGLFVTAWLGIFEVSSGRLTFSSAGHEYPALKCKSDNFELLIEDNLPPLAAMEDMKYENTFIDMHEGDELFLYTDGVLDAKNRSGERFGMDKMVEILTKNKDKPPEDQIKDLKQDIDSFTDSGDPFDDITMLMFKVK